MEVSFRVRVGVPIWEELGYSPAVFVRVANKGLRGYGTWKKIRKNIGRGLTQRAKRLGAQRTQRGLKAQRARRSAAGCRTVRRACSREFTTDAIILFILG
jgi:hypothetical protein